MPAAALLHPNNVVLVKAHNPNFVMGHGGHEHGDEVMVMSTTASAAALPTAVPSSAIARDGFGVLDSLDAVCRSMPQLPSCALYDTCSMNSTALPTPYCTPTSLISNLCQSTSATLTTLQSQYCTSYRQACPSSSSPNCSPMPSLPPPTALAATITSLCNMHDMGADCKSCEGDVWKTGSGCRLLPAYIRMCKEMPGMAQCGDYKEMCTGGVCESVLTAGLRAANGDGGALSTTSTTSSGGHDGHGGDGMMMKSTFHTDIQIPFLVTAWTPKTPVHYFLAWLLTFVLALLYEAWVSLPMRLERRYPSLANLRVDPIVASRRGSDSTVVYEGVDGGDVEGFKGKMIRGFYRGGMRIVGAALAYVLMLIVMTFNLGLFFAVVVGLGIGSSLFGGAAVAGQASRRDGKQEMARDCC
ncbi:hypothetical protein HDU67_003229 [Dinochytrium kinnereticum]|nr:hypothetical protein HDU67_003229 [Dinochytrium kinnereticum]